MTFSSELVLHKQKMEETNTTFNSQRTENNQISTNYNYKMQAKTNPRNKFSQRYKQSSKNLLSLRANIGLVFLTFILYFTHNQHLTSVEACLCHLIPNFQCPPPPTCCESGQFAKDECGCCLTCAKAELQPCGGPSGAHGKCSTGLQCLKTCTACTTLSSGNPEPCVFPFRYDGVDYNECTSVDAANPGNVWCATEVAREFNNTVIDGRWGDCAESCPGARRACNDKRFEIIVGKCINPQVPGAIPNWFGAPAFRLLEKTQQLFPAPFCSGKGRASKSRPKYSNTCRCAEGQDAFEITTDGTVRGNCTGIDNNLRDDHDPVWCFLENVRDPANPKSGCYSDTRWSAKDGRFWSARACDGLPPIEGNEVIEVDPTQLINNAARSQFVRPPKFTKPRELPRSFTTKRPITTRRTTRRTTPRPIATTTTEDIFAYDDEDPIEESLTDRLIKTNRVHISQLRGRKKPSPQSSTEPEAIRQELGNLFLKTADAEDSTSKGGFGARQTTTDNNIEDDYGAVGNGDDFPEEDRSSRVFDGGPALANIDYNDEELDYLYDYYNEEAYDDRSSSLNSQNRPKLRHGGSRGSNLLSQIPRTKDISKKNKKKEDDFFADLLIVNQRENGVESHTTPQSINIRQSTTLPVREFPATRTDPLAQANNEFASTEFDEDDPPPLTTAKTDFPGQGTTPSPFEFGAKLAKAKSRFANRFKFNRRKFLNDIKEKTGSIKFVNTKRNRARLNEEARKRRPIIQTSNDYDDPEPRTTARTTTVRKDDPAPRPTRRPIPKLEFTTPPASIDEDPVPATTAKGILNQAIAHNKKRIKAQILKQKKEISRSGIVPPSRTFLLNQKKTEEENEANLEEKKEFKIIDAEELFDRLVEKNAPTTTTTTTTSTTIAPITTPTTENAEYEDEDIYTDYENVEEEEVEELITTLSSISSKATTLKPILEKEPLGQEVEYEDNEEGSGDALPITTSRSTTEPNKNQNPSDQVNNSSNHLETSTSNTVTIPPLDPTSEAPEKIPSPVPLTQNKSPQIDASKSLGEILAELPKEKLEKFKQYLLTLSKDDKKLVSKMLQSNLEAARKSITTTTASPYTSNDAVIDLGILGTFRLEKPKRSEDKLLNNQIKT